MLKRSIIFLLLLFLFQLTFAKSTFANNCTNAGGSCKVFYTVPANNGGQPVYANGSTPQALCQSYNLSYLSYDDDCGSSTSVSGTTDYVCCGNVSQSTTCSNAGGYCSSNTAVTGACSFSDYYYDPDLDSSCTGTNGCCVPVTCQYLGGYCSSHTQLTGACSISNYVYNPVGDGSCPGDSGCCTYYSSSSSGGGTGGTGGSGGVSQNGWIDSRNSSACQAITGWACLSDGTQVEADLYMDAPYPNGTYLGKVAVANQNTPDNAAPFCGGNNNVGFTFPTSMLRQDGSQHSYYVYGNTGSSAWILNNSPQSATCGYSISGRAYVDYNHNGAKDGADYFYSGTVRTNTGKSDVTDPSTGIYSITGLSAGTYTIVISLPVGGWKSVITPSVTVGPNQSGKNVSMTPLYSISGNVFVDDGTVNDGTTIKNGRKDVGESGYGGGTVTLSNGPTSAGPFTVAANGTYTTGQVLQAGTYTVTYSSALPTGFKNTTPLSWSVTVGNPASTQAGYMCSVGASLDASCGNPQSGSISGLDFGISDINSWSQFICADGRFGSGYSQNIPSTADCGGTASPYAITSSAICTTNPGILFSGSTNPSYGAGTGASTTGMVVGDSLFPENFTPRIPNTIATSYSFVDTTLNNLDPAPTALTSICPSLANCVLSEDTPGGTYTTTAADGPVSISISNADGTYALGNAKYTFVIGGDLTLASPINVANGEAANGTAAFISHGDIHVASSVGESNWDSISPDIAALLSADGNFVLDAANASGQQCDDNLNPKELKLNVQGSIVVNAAGTGGTIQNNRDGCTQDKYCPALTVKSNPLLILNAPGPVRPPYSKWQELNP